MQIENVASVDVVSAGIQTNKSAGEGMSAKGRFIVECFDSEGNLKWCEDNENLVVNVGVQDMNTQYFKGSAYTATLYIGLYGAAASNNPAASDTMASHAGWTEVTAYSQTTRPQAVFGTATTASTSVISNSGSVAVFSINGSATVGGAFLVQGAAGTANTKGGTGGTLFSASDFQAPGDRSVVNGDTLNVTYQFSLTAT
jgi:hypothetical protein